MLVANYALAKWSCDHGGPPVLNVITAAAFIVTVIGGVLSWRVLASLPDEAPTDGLGEAGILRFLALLGLATTALFLFALIAAAVPPLVIDGCH
jgi:hypothetical protein